MNRTGLTIALCLALLVSLVQVGPVVAQQNDMGTGGDAGETIATAALISAGSGTGSINANENDYYDYYKVSVTAGQTISVSMTPTSPSDFDLVLYNTAQLEVDSSYLGGSSTDTVEYVATSSGYFYINVEYYSVSGTYSMTVTVTGGTTQNDMGTSTDAGNSFDTATAISAGSGTGYIDTADTADWYKVSVSSGQMVSVSMTSPSGSDFDLGLFASATSQLDSSTYGGSTTETVEGTATASGYLYIKVYQYSGSGIYSMTVTVTGGTTQNDMGSGGDAGDILGAATEIAANTTGTGFIDATDYIDYYKVQVASGQTIRVSVTPPSGADFDITLYDPNRNYVDSSSLGGSQTDEAEWAATASGYFYIRVERYSGSGIYSMIVTVTGGVTQNDMGTGVDAGNSLSAATAIPAGSGTGYIDSTDTDDYYKVSVSSGQTVSVSMTSPSGSDFDLYLYNTAQSQIDSSTYGGSTTETVEGTSTASGYFYIRVERYSGSGIYTLRVSIAGGPTQNDMGSGGDAGDILGAATEIAANTTGTGFIDATDYIDYYKVQVASGQTIRVSVTPPSGADFDLTLYGPDQNYVDGSSLGGSQTDTVEGTATTSGYFYIRVDRFSGSGIYSMTVTVTGGTTQNDMGTGGDAGNSLSAATTIAAGSGTGYLDLTDTADYYRVSVTSGQTIRVSMTPPSGSDFDLELNNTSLLEVDYSYLGGSQTDTVEATATASGYFYIKVDQYSGSGIYSMTVTVTGGTTQNDMDTGIDAGNTMSVATTIAPRTGTGYLSSTDTDDYYKVQVSSGQTVSVSLTPPSGADFDLTLYDTTQDEVDSSSLGGSQTDSVTGAAAASGYFYIYVEQYSGSGVYSLTVTVTGVAVATQNDWGSSQDAGDTGATALTISAGTGTGYVDITDTDDYYKIQVGQGATISATLTPPSGSDFDLYLLGTNQSEVASSVLGGSRTDNVSYEAASTGYYYIRVFRYNGSGTYSLNVSVSTAGALVESAHPYANNFDYTWAITRPGAGRLRARFSQLNLESGWDYVYIYDENNNFIESFTGSLRNENTSWVDGSAIKIRIITDGSNTDYGFTVDDVQTEAAVSVGPTNKYAILVGINQYQNLSRLNYTINDAQDWKNYLQGQGYTISYFLTDSQATEANIKAAVADVVSRAGPNDTIVYVHSSHGAKSDEVGLPAGNSIIAAYDASNGTNGIITDTELQDAFSGFSGRLFVFVDACRSGGMNEVVTNAGANAAKRYYSAASGANGYGYDRSDYSNGAWTYWFLERGLVGQGFTTAEQAFAWANAQYNPESADDEPMEFDGDLTNPFSMNP